MTQPENAPSSDYTELASLIYRALLGRDEPAENVAELADILASGVRVEDVLKTLLQTDERQKLEEIISNQPLFVPFGHFYSPYIDQTEAEQALARAKDAVRTQKRPAGIDLNIETQHTLWEAFRPYFSDYDPPTEQTAGWRFFGKNVYFGRGDCSILYGMMRHFKPKRYVEIGSGFSSAFALDVIEKFLDGQTHCTFIDPYPERLHQLLTKEDWERTNVIVDRVQNVDLNVFASMDANDILFIDSSHVMKTGSDLCAELFDILPSVKPGVLIHFHDIPYPFEYTADWVFTEQRNWNEAYALRAFLQYNTDFEIVFFNGFMAAEKAQEIPALLNIHSHWGQLGSGIWLRRK